MDSGQVICSFSLVNGKRERGIGIDNRIKKDFSGAPDRAHFGDAAGPAPILRLVLSWKPRWPHSCLDRMVTDVCAATEIPQFNATLCVLAPHLRSAAMGLLGEQEKCAMKP